MRQIILDTETTGLEPEKGHKIIEIGCVELIDRRQTGNNFHKYINPEREIDADATKIHGITNELLIDKPVFADVLNDFLNFINGSELIAHNATFDVNFINYEMRLLNKATKPLNSHASIFDTLALARKMFPGQRNSLDALCKRYKINLDSRKFHGALLDAQLLAEVYLLMTGGQGTLFSDDELNETDSVTKILVKENNKNRAPSPTIYADSNEITEHERILKEIKKREKNEEYHT